jgi:hypothetical protein
MKAPGTTFFLILLLCGTAPLRGQTQNVLTLDQALNRARLKGPVLLSAKARIEEARGHLKGASMLLQGNPVIEGTVGPRLSDQGRTTDGDISVTQDFEAIGRRSARIAGAQTGVTREIAASRETGRALLHCRTSLLWLS